MLDEALVRSGHLLDPLKRAVADSALPVTIGVVLLACGFLATVTFAVLSIVTPWAGASALIALAAGIAAVLLGAPRRRQAPRSDAKSSCRRPWR